MNIKKHILSIVTVGILLSLAGLAAIQISWLNKAIVTNKQIFVQKIDQGAKESAEKYRGTSNLPSEIHQLLQEKPVNGRAVDLLIKPILNEALSTNSIPLNYEYGIYKHKGTIRNELIFGTTNKSFIDNSTCNQKSDRNFGWTNLTCNSGYEKGNDYHLAIFPSYSSFVFDQVKYSLVAFILFLILIFSGFYYLIKTINTQKKVSEIKNDFINNLTHEFKTPIFSMSLASKSIRESVKNNKPEKLNMYIDVIDSESNRLKRQVDKILQLSLLDSQKLQLQKKHIDIHKQLKEVSKSLKLVLEEVGGSINFNLNAYNFTISADEEHLKNVWFNILDNAIKYNKDKPIIDIETKNLDNSIHISIQDNGIGMGLDKQKMIFDKFYRVPTGNVHNVKGFGVGLSYVKSILKLHDGDIEVVSKINKGSVFKIILPINGK